jgi:hypothetical protein
MKAETKELIKSAVITFVAGFALVVIPELDTLSLDSLQDGTVVGLLFAGVRTGLKMLLEMYLTWYNNK